MKRFFKAYTLAEVVITMLVIAAVVSVSIKIAKTKMDSIISYTYYSAYQTLVERVAVIRANFRDEEIYTSFAPTTESPKFGECGENQLYKIDRTCYEYGQPSTLPRNGFNFCLKFAEGVNVLSTFAESSICNGSQINNIDPDFNSAIPDLVLANGIRIFNMSKTPLELHIDSLAGPYPENEFFDIDGNFFSPYHAKGYGYIVYVDIDGAANGNNVFEEDIFRFFITLSGNVIPDTGSLSTNPVGANNKMYLQVSVMQIFNGAPVKWVKKSITFQEAFCGANILGVDTPYCTSFEVFPECHSPNICTLHTLKPSTVLGVL